MLCYGFGLYQCVYCCFGTSSIEAIGNHLANKHPSKLTFYCQRSERLQDNTSPYQSIPHDQIEGTCLKQVKLTVKKECLLSPPKDDELMRNYSNIGKLGENLQIEGIKTIKSSNPPLETPKTYYVRDMTLKDSGQPVAAKRLSLPEKLRISMEMPKLRQIPTKSLTETILKIPSPESNASSASSFKNNSKFDNLKGSMPARTFSERTKPSQSQLSKLLTADLDTFKLDGIDVKKETISPPATSTATESPFDLQIKNVFSLTEGKSIAAADWFA